MEKIAISKIVEFRRKKTRSSQMTFVNNIKKIKPKGESGEGGDYWIHSSSTIANAFKSEQNELIDEKIEVLKEKHRAADANISKNMFQKNLNILSNFLTFDFTKIKPIFKLQYLPKPREKSIFTLRSLPIQVLPHHVFMFEEKGIKKLGAVWFVAKLDGYSNEELGIFSEALYRYLKHNYSKKFEIASDFCIAVDVVKVKICRYTRILDKEVPSIINSTLDSIRKIMNSSND